MRTTSQINQSIKTTLRTLVKATSYIIKQTQGIINTVKIEIVANGRLDQSGEHAAQQLELNEITSEILLNSADSIPETIRSVYCLLLDSNCSLLDISSTWDLDDNSDRLYLVDEAGNRIDVSFSESTTHFATLTYFNHAIDQVCQYFQTHFSHFLGDKSLQPAMDLLLLNKKAVNHCFHIHNKELAVKVLFSFLSTAHQLSDSSTLKSDHFLQLIVQQTPRLIGDRYSFATEGEGLDSLRENITTLLRDIDASDAIDLSDRQSISIKADHRKLLDISSRCCFKLRGIDFDDTPAAQDNALFQANHHLHHGMLLGCDSLLNDPEKLFFFQTLYKTEVAFAALITELQKLSLSTRVNTDKNHCIFRLLHQIITRDTCKQVKGASASATPIDADVRIAGLVKATKYNDRHATVIGKSADNRRLKVRLFDVDDPGVTVNIKPTNLIALKDISKMGPRQGYTDLENYELAVLQSKMAR